MMRSLKAFLLCLPFLAAPAQAQFISGQGGSSGATALTGLSDTNVTESSAFDGTLLYWGNVANKWQQFAGFPGHLTGNWYVGTGLYSQAATAAFPSITRQLMYPFVVMQTMTVDQLGVNITTVGTSNIQLGLYANGSWGRPGNLLSNTASIVNTATGQASALLGSNQQLTPGVYWMAIQCDDTAMKANGMGYISGGSLGSSTLTNVVNGAPITGVYTASTFGTWTSFTSGTTWTDVTGDVIPAIAYHVHSVP